MVYSSDLIKQLEGIQRRDAVLENEYIRLSKIFY